MAKKTKKQLVPRTRNGGTETESQHIGKIRSALRKISQFWKPIQQAKHSVRRKNQSSNARLKFEYQCNICKCWHPEKEVEVNHKIPAGSLKSYADLPAFCERLFNENVDDYEVLCIPCHVTLTHAK